MRRIVLATVAACVVAAVTISAQFAVFNEGYEGEIWELLATLELPDVVDDNGDPVPYGNWASGIAWVEGELFVADNYSSVITKFDENLQPVVLPDADWYGHAGSPTHNWAPNEATAAEVWVDGVALQALIVTDALSSRIFAFRSSGEHLFTLGIPDETAYTPGLNGVAVTVGARFELDQSNLANPTLRIVGRLAVAAPEYLDLAAGGALIYDNREFAYNPGNGRFEAAAPDAVLTGGETETNDPTVPAVKALTGVTFDSAGNFYMVDSWTGRLHGYDSALQHRFVFGTPDASGGTTEEFEEAYGMTLWPSDAGDRLLITVPLKNQAVVYAPVPRTGGAPVTLEYLFKLDGLGAVDGLPHSSAFDPRNGRVAVSDSGDNSVKVFQTPVLAAFDLRVEDTAQQPVASVCGGDTYSVSFSLTVPEGRSAVQNVAPRLLVNGVETSVVPAPGDPSYGVEGVGPLNPRDVISYTYEFTAPNTGLPQALTLVAGATAETTSVGGDGSTAPLTDILEKTFELPVIDCGSGNQRPTIAASMSLAPEASGWTRITPVIPAAIDFAVTLTAADSDGTISRINYSASGANPMPMAAAFNVDAVEIPLTQAGITTIFFQAFDNELMPSLSGSVVVRLDNTLPSICLNIPEPQAKKPNGEWWWNNTVTIPVVLTDNQDPSPDIMPPIPAQYLAPNLVFSSEGAAQVATLIAEDHAGHQRVQPSDTTLDVCGPGKVGRLINIDKTAPAVSENLDEAVVYESSVTLTISGADGLSGVRYIDYSFDNFATSTRVEAASVELLLTAPATVSFRSIDWAGNSSPIETRSYQVNDPPAANADSYATDENTLTVAAPGVLANDTDPEANPLSAVLVAGPSHGSLTLSANGGFSYTPALHFAGSDSFTYRANDGHAVSDVATVSITVTPVNDAPVAAADVAATAHNTPVTIAVLANDVASDRGDSLSVQSIADIVGGTAVANGNGTITFTPSAGFEGAASFSYTVVDQGGLTATAGVIVHVAPANAAPVCNAAFAAADLWPPNHQRVDVTVAGVTDADNQALTIAFTSILQDEPTNSVGQGNTMQDGGIEQNGARAWVRAERSGTNRVPGDGRVYLIGFTATDALGASCSGTVRLDVPHDRRGNPAVLSPGRWNSITGQLVTAP